MAKQYMRMVHGKSDVDDSDIRNTGENMCTLKYPETSSHSPGPFPNDRKLQSLKNK